jgi:hypothetical protein
MKDKDRILLEILSRYGADQITVTGVRDQLLSHYSDDTINPADARRWVNGKFSTLLNKGVLIRKKLPDSKKFYFKKTSYYEQYISSEPQPVSLTKTCAIPIDIKAEKRSHPLHTELESYRQTMLSQLGEIEEYRRIRETYPDLGDAAAVQFQEVADDNYRMLGRIRALEKLIANAP